MLSLIVSRYGTIFPPHPDLFIGNTSLNSCDSLKILGVIFDSKFTFERHTRSIFSLVAEKISLFGKFFLGLWGSGCLTEMFQFFHPSLFASLYGPLQQIPILNFLIRISKLVNF